MEFTRSGTELVQSVVFARALGSYLAELNLEGNAEDVGIKSGILMIAWAASGHDINQPPSGAELSELTDFIKRHNEELNRLAGAVLEKLVGYHTGSKLDA